MPAGLDRDFRRQAEQAENEKDAFDACHVGLPDRRLEAAASARGLERGFYQEMPNLAAMRRAFASSLS